MAGTLHMSRRGFMCAAGAMALGAATSKTEARARPNILLIHADDHGQWGVGAYENPDVHTPNLDRLAEDGALFTRAFVSTPVCSPARASLLTGLDSLQHGIKDWIRPGEGIGLDPSLPVFPELLKQAGYRTGYIGKWHLGEEEQCHPLRRGFDYYMGFLTGGTTPVDPVLEIEGVTEKREGWLIELMTDDAARWIKENASSPFFCMVSYREPHAPFKPVQDQDAAPYAGKTLDLFPGSETAPEEFHDLLAQYYACCTAVDRCSGRLLKALEHAGVAENTLVIFTGDNGYMIGQHGLHSKGNAHFVAQPGGCRPNMFDPSILVPMIARWPGEIAPGSKIDEMTSHLDFLETFCDVAAVPRRARPKNEGMSLLPLLRGRRAKSRKELYGSYDQYQYEPKAHLRMIRTDRWKLVKNLEEGGVVELYDLENDPGELVNLATNASSGDTQKKLESRLARWQKRVGDPLINLNG